MADTATEKAALEDIVASLTTTIDALKPQIEGIQHELEAKDLSAEAVQNAQENLARYDAQRTALITRRNIIQSALADGYPDLYAPLPARVVPVSVFAELQQNLAAQQAAITTYQVEDEAVTGTFTLGTAEPKP